MKITHAFAFLLLPLGCALAQSPAEQGLEKLKSLAGSWQGTGPNNLNVSLTYEVVSDGNAVIETRVPDKEPSMITLFHLDGDRLMLTHYCAIGNQPRMAAQTVAVPVRALRFDFLDATNVKPKQGHMYGLALEFTDSDHFKQVWTWRQDGQNTDAPFNFERVKQ